MAGDLNCRCSLLKGDLVLQCRLKKTASSGFLPYLLSPCPFCFTYDEDRYLFPSSSNLSQLSPLPSGQNRFKIHFLFCLQLR